MKECNQYCLGFPSLTFSTTREAAIAFPATKYEIDIFIRLYIYLFCRYVSIRIYVFIRI
jgi:hypothetical protein